MKNYIVKIVKKETKIRKQQLFKETMFYTLFHRLRDTKQSPDKL